MEKRTIEEKNILVKLTGYAVANCIAFGMIGISYLLINFFNGNDNVNSNKILIYSEFVIVPAIMGFVSAWFWRNLNLTGGNLTLSCVKNCIIAIVLSALFLHEGVICLIIVSPLLFAFIMIGAFTGRSIFKRNNQTLKASIGAMLLASFVIDSTSTHHYENMVADEIVINAPISKVWKNVVAYKRNTSPDEYWLFKIGMPSPVESTTEGYYVGAKRKCIFSNGYVFDEKIVVYEENKDLTFDITDQPRDPEIMGHIDILRGQFLLHDNGDGTTTVTGNSWYRLYVFPVWYYDIWAKSITRNVHLRVMEHIKQISEAQ